MIGSTPAREDELLLEEELVEVPALRDIVLDFDAEGRLVGIEILAAERWLPLDDTR